MFFFFRNLKVYSFHISILQLQNQFKYDNANKYPKNTC